MASSTRPRPATGAASPALALFVPLLGAIALLAGCHHLPTGDDADWSAYNGHPDGDHYSALADIKSSNVGRLKEAWRTTWAEPGDPETNPLVIDGIVYGYTPSLHIVALDGATGRTLWTFDPGLQGIPVAPGIHFTGPARGMALWRHGKERRLLAGVMQYLFAIDPSTGQLIRSFGKDGAIDLREGLRGDPANFYVSLTTPGIVFEDELIVGFRTGETHPAPPGDIRAFDVRTGRLRWQFHTIPHAGEAGSETWPPSALPTAGAANNWAGMALDAGRGIVYVPTGSAVADFYGADRVGDDLYANTLLALDARTGKRLWHFQGVHHDVWDRDFPAPPTLLTVERDGRRIPAVAQPTKQGYVYLFDRVTGHPLFPIREVPYPASTVPGEVTSPTQPKPDLPAPIARQRLDESSLTVRTPAAHDWALEQFRNFASDGQFVPMAANKPTVVFPGFDGGAEWGGAAVDPRHGILYVNANDVAWTGSVVPTVNGGGLGSALYQQNCASCHGAERKGSPPAIPSLVDVASRLRGDEVATVIRDGRGRMPPFRSIQSYFLAALISYAMTGEEPAGGARPPAPAVVEGGRSDMQASIVDDPLPAAYRFAGFVKFLDPDGYPAVKPPWGTLNAIDLNTGQFLWTVPLGSYPELAAQGLGQTGCENYGGPLLTAGGVLFIGATIYDRKLHAYDPRTGSLLWEGALPYSGTATPATYRAHGRQYVIVATSNARTPGATQGGGYVAYALPD